MRSTTWYRLAAAGAAMIVLLNTLVASHSLNTLFRAEAWRSHTLEVLTHTKAMALESRTADSAVRGFILTGNAEFEDRFHVATQGVFAELATVKELTKDNVSQRDRLAFLRNRITVKNAALDAGIAIRKAAAGPLNPSLLQNTLSDSPDGGPSVAYAIAQMEGEEDRLLQDRTRYTEIAHTQVWASFLGASALDLLLIFAAFSLLLRTTRDRERIAADTAQIATLNVELTQLNTDLEERVELRTRELALSNQELEAFSYSVSHDLRAPLRTIDGFSLALQEDFADCLNDEGRDYILRVRNGVQRMGTLIDSLLQLSRVTRSDLVAETVDMSQLSTLVFNELKSADTARDVRFSAEPGILVQGDSRLLRIALENLIGNAFKFTSRTPAALIEFGVTHSGQFPGREGNVYFIRDNGAGFDMQYVDRLFTAFQRLHGDRDFKGSGIGLATVSRIIRRHHGEIWAESEVGKGATFFFTIATQPQPSTP